jgi:hypothetical protein
VAGLAAAPLAAYFATHPGAFSGRMSELSVWRAAHSARQAAIEVVLNTWRTARMFFIHGDYNWRHNYPWRAALYWPVAAFLVIGLIRRRKEKWVPILWLAVGALPVVFSGQDVPHALRSILMLPPAMLLAGLGADGTYNLASRRLPAGVAIACVAIVLALVAYDAYHTYFDLWARNREMPRAFDSDSAEMAREIRSLPGDEEKYVVTPPGADMRPQSVMFLTGSYTAREQAATHIHYIADADCAGVKAKMPGARVFCLTPGSAER